ncbi:GL25791 [Drosophila persimilis]|uniref:GL25791 n=1 Tax=Drosophila persimilis TaxID=7234 RepID=B4GJW5_DROPE|nr:uncharacterized protein LOC6593453 [Drosophila persimilis]XP_026843842.1 uncharacterized protein LOC6593453 [Drosophila persimilis]EDW36931.1 GL25791 [Drosophila persimilis]
MASCRAPAQPRQQQPQQPACPPMSLPVSYPYMDAQQLQQFYIAQMLQPQPPLGPNVYVQPWYMCQPPSCQNYGYCYGMQMPPSAMLPQDCSCPSNTPSIQSTGSENSTGSCCRPTTSTRCVPQDRKRSPAGGRTYQQCNVPLPETACGWCGSLDSFESDGSALLEAQRYAACSICPAPKLKEIQRRQQQEEVSQNDSEMEQNLASKKEHKIAAKKFHRIDSENGSQNGSKIDSENEEEVIDSENHSRKASKKEQRKDLKRAQRHFSKEERGSSKEERDSSKEERHSSKEERDSSKEERGSSKEKRHSSKEERHSSKEEKCSAKKHHKEAIKPAKPAKPATLKEDIDSALGSSASSFIKRLGVLMRHRSTRSSVKRKQAKAPPTPCLTPACSNTSSESLRQPPMKSSFLSRLFGEVRDNDMAFYAQKSRCNIQPQPSLHSDSLEQLAAFKKLRKKQRLSAKGPYEI